MIYRLLAPFVRLTIRIFYRRIEAHGRERIPRGCPLLFAANHPNMAMDPFMLAFHHDRPVHFMAKSTLFSWTPLAWLLRSLGVIPVYRRMDTAGQTDRNRESFAECFRALERGEAVGIFPEGTSIYAPRLLPLKTGAARIVLEAEASNDFALGVRIVPVGLNFLDRDTFRSDVLALFGDPIDPSAVFDLYRNDPVAAVQELTSRIERSLVLLTRNLKEDQDDRFVRRLAQIYKAGFLSADATGAPRNLREAFSVDRGIVEAYAYFADSQPLRTRRVKGDIERYLYLTERLGLDEEALGARRRPLGLLWTLAVELPLLVVVGLPILLWGCVTNWVPHRLTGLVAARFSADLTEVATYKVAFGALFYLIWYGMLAAVIGRYAAPAAVFGALASFPIAGLLTLEIADRAAQLSRHLRALVLCWRGSGRLATLEKLRDEIMAELRVLASEWRRVVPT